MTQAAAASSTNVPLTTEEEDQLLLCQDGYAWDYVLVFPALEARLKHQTSPLDDIFSLLSPKRVPMTVDEICFRLKSAGISLRLIHGPIAPSSQPLYCLIRATPEVLAREADRIDLIVPMDKEALRRKSFEGFQTQGIEPFPIEDPLHLYKMTPYENIHFKYTCRQNMQDMYLKQGPNSSLFTSCQRMLLLESIMTNRHGGAGLDLAKLDHVNVFTTYFPLHDDFERTKLIEKWLKWAQWPWQQPLHAIQSYFGSRIGLYFGFLGYNTTWVMTAAIFWLVLWLLDYSRQLKSNILIVSVSVCIILWSTAFLKFWRRYNARLALLWGTADLKHVEQVRPQYVGQLVRSPINGQPMLYFSRKEKIRRRIFTCLLLCLLIAIVIFVVCGNFYLQYVMLERGYTINLGETEISLAAPVTSIANVVQINVMHLIYDAVCQAMTDYENHRTETTHEDAFILKSVYFHVVNNYAGLCYITFVKSYIGAHCVNDDCLGELRLYLLTIFALQLLNGLVQDLILPRARVFMGKMTKGKFSEHGFKSIDNQFQLSDYSWRITFTQYLSLVMRFGFMILFIGASPAMPVLTMLNNLIELRANATRLLMDHRRPVPRLATNIGKWMTVLETFATLAIFTNGFVLVYTSNAFEFDVNDPHAALYRLRYFGSFVTVMLVVRYTVSTWLHDIPLDVTAQLKRQQFLATKIYIREADDAVPVYNSSVSISNRDLSEA